MPQDMIACPGCGVIMDLSPFAVRPTQVVCPRCDTVSIVPPLAIVVPNAVDEIPLKALENREPQKQDLAPVEVIAPLEEPAVQKADPFSSAPLDDSLQLFSYDGAQAASGLGEKQPAAPRHEALHARHEAPARAAEDKPAHDTPVTGKPAPDTSAIAETAPDVPNANEASTAKAAEVEPEEPSSVQTAKVEPEEPKTDVSARVESEEPSADVSARVELDEPKADASLYEMEAVLEPDVALTTSAIKEQMLHRDAQSALPQQQPVQQPAQQQPAQQQPIQQQDLQSQTIKQPAQSLPSQHVQAQTTQISSSVAPGAWPQATLTNGALAPAGAVLPHGGATKDARRIHDLATGQANAVSQVLPIDRKGNAEPLAFAVLGLLSVLSFFPPLGIVLCMTALMMNGEEKRHGFNNSYASATSVCAIIGLILNCFAAIGALLLMGVLFTTPAVLLASGV